MKKILNINKKFKNNKGSITSFTLLSMLFFLIVVIAIYASVNTKVQKQQKELNTIQKSYEQQEQINDIYEKKYDDYINSETSTIQVYADTNLKGEVKGQKKNTLGTVYTNVAQNKIKIFGGANSTYAYSETADGKRIVLSGNEMTIQATTSGKTIYTWVKGEDGEYTKYYTAVTVKLSTLQDKTIYVAEGKSTDIEITGENKGKITYSQIDTSYISIENNKVTGIKAGDTTITATESNGGAQAKITIKIVKLTLEKTKGITTVGDNKKIQVSGINNGTISAKSNDETIAKVTVSGTEVTIIPQKVGNIKITITESNAGASTEYEIQVVSITLAQNGGKYTMPTTGKATIKTKVKVENASKIEVAWTSSTLEWKTIENNSEIIKNDCEKGTYYLYVKVDDEYLYQSQAFIVGEEKISINITTAEWTNKDITATIEYPNITVANTRKAGYGTTLADAQISASSSTAPTTSLTATANGYVYATAEDNAGNVITTSVQITNIDKTAPIIETPTISTTNWTTESVTIASKAKDDESGIAAFQWSTNPGLTTSSEGWTTITATNSQITQTYTAYKSGTYYFYVKDVAGNIGQTSIIVNNIVQIGDYVNYQLEELDENELNELKTNLDTYSGAIDDQNSKINRDNNLEWRILDIDKTTGKMRLISATEASKRGRIKLKGYMGYNNGVKLIDDACDTLYSNKKLTSKVQNLKIEDIQDKMKEKDYTKFYKRYGEINIAYPSGGSIFYPSIFLKEKEQKVKNGNITIEGTELGLSEQNEYIKQEKENVIEEVRNTDYENADKIEAKVTHWSKKMEEEDFYDSKYYEIFMGGKTEEDTFNTNYLSSRCIALWDLEGTIIEYCISTMGQVDGWIDENEYIELYEESSDDYSMTNYIRPVITLKPEIRIDTTNLGEGTQDKPFKIK